jgi:hypothetical protein
MPNNPASAPASPTDWAEVRRRYETTDERVADICADAGITPKELANAARRETWRRQFPRPFPVGRRPAVPPPAEATTARARRTAAASPDTPGSSHSVVTSAAQQATGAACPAPSAPYPATGAQGSTIADLIDVWRAQLVRLTAAVTLKLEQLELRMTKDLAADKAGSPTASTSDHEREARALGALTDTLGKFTEIATDLDTRANGGTSADPDAAAEAERNRQDFAERLGKIVDALEARAARGSQPAER